MNIGSKSAWLALVASSFLAGCAAQEDFPSLARRPIETKSAATVPVAPPPPVLAASDPARITRLSQITDRARKGQSGFDQAYAAATRAVGSMGARGSDRWAEAQMAVSRVERAQGPVEAAMADMDEEKRILVFAPPSVDQAAVDAAWAEVNAINENQHLALRGLIDRLGGR